MWLLGEIIREGSWGGGEESRKLSLRVRWAKVVPWLISQGKFGYGGVMLSW